jgi:hypothetical protein
VGVKEWKEIIQDLEKWRDIVLAAKTLIVIKPSDDDDDTNYRIP